MLPTYSIHPPMHTCTQSHYTILYCRDICIIADDLMSHTTACLTLYFIGYNDDPPVVTYEATSNATFTEGHPEHIPIITGDLNVTDQDHPTRLVCCL